jgi:hypothetical protein
LNYYQSFNALQLSHAALHVLLVALDASDEMNYAFRSATLRSFITLTLQSWHVTNQFDGIIHRIPVKTPPQGYAATATHLQCSAKSSKKCYP